MKTLQYIKSELKNSTLLKLSVLLFAIILFFGCKKDFPIDEDGLLITTRTETGVSNFDLLGTDYVSTRSKLAAIDTLNGTINVELLFGTDLKNLYPQFTLAQDCKLEPKITGKTDFSDLANPKTYVVVSGNRKVRKPYTIYIKVLKP